MKTLYCHLLSLLSQEEIELKRIRRVRSGSQGHAKRMSIQIPLQHCGCEMELSGLKIMRVQKRMREKEREKEKERERERKSEGRKRER